MNQPATEKNKASGATPQMPHEHPILRLAIDHFKPSDILFTDVPEWCGEDENPARIYFKPFTLRDKAFVARKAEKEGVGLEATADLIIRKALDENGNKLFSDVHRSLLLEQVDPDVLSSLAAIMTATKTVKDHEKN